VYYLVGWCRIALKEFPKPLTVKITKQLQITFIDTCTLTLRYWKEVLLNNCEMQNIDSRTSSKKD
jgi:hypothetical protein